MSASGERRVEDPDAQVANVVGRVLGAGVVIAVVLVVAGLVVTLVSHPHFVVGPISYHVLVGRRAHFPVGLGGLVRALRHGRGEGIVLLGAVILLATPPRWRRGVRDRLCDRRRRTDGCCGDGGAGDPRGRCGRPLARRSAPATDEERWAHLSVPDTLARSYVEGCPGRSPGSRSRAERHLGRLWPTRSACTRLCEPRPSRHGPVGGTPSPLAPGAPAHLRHRHLRWQASHPPPVERICGRLERKSRGACRTAALPAMA